MAVTATHSFFCPKTPQRGRFTLRRFPDYQDRYPITLGALKPLLAERLVRLNRIIGYELFPIVTQGTDPSVSFSSLNAENSIKGN